MLKPEIIGHHFLHLLSPPRLSVLFYESESYWHQRDQRIVSHGPHIITKNNSFEIKVSPPRSLLDSLSNYFLLVKDGIMSKHRRLLVHIKGKKILRISALCQLSSPVGLIHKKDNVPSVQPPSSETQGQISRAGRKGATKVFKHGFSSRLFFRPDWLPLGLRECTAF